MLQNLLYFVIISSFALLWGNAFLLLFAPSLQRNREKISLEIFILSFFGGLAIISIISAWVSILAPVQFWLLCILTILPVILCWRNKLYLTKLNYEIIKDITKLEIALLLSALLLFFILSSGRVVLTDADLYHVQTIKWNHEYGTIKGLANLYPRYGYYSNWLYTISLFQLPFSNQNFTYLNTTFNVWLLLLVFLQYKRFSTKNTPVYKHLSLYYFLILLYLLFEWDLFRVSSSSTTNDFVITGSVIISIHLLLQIFLVKDKRVEYQWLLLLILTTAPFYKMPGFMLIGFWLIYFFLSPQKKQIFIFSVVFALVGFIPFAIKNYLQTGYIFFPYNILHFSETEWQVPAAIVDLHSKFIYLSNHYINSDAPNFPHTDFSKFSYYNDWFLALVTEEKVFIILCLVGIPLTLFFLPKIYKENTRLILLLWGACMLAAIFWLLSSPILRFSFGFLIFLAIFPLSALLISYFKRITFSILIILTVVISISYTFNKAKSSISFKNLLTPVAFYNTLYKPVTLNGFNYQTPIFQNAVCPCYDAPLPCIYQINPYLKPIGNNISDGFKMDTTLSREFLDTYRN